MLIAAALFVGGLATHTNHRNQISRGKITSGARCVFAGVATMVAIITTGGGLPAVYGAVIAASLVDYALRLTSQNYSFFHLL